MHQMCTNALTKLPNHKMLTTGHSVAQLDKFHLPDAVAFAVHSYGKEIKGLFHAMQNDPQLIWLSVSSESYVQGVITLKQIKDKFKIYAFCASLLDVARALLRKCVELSSVGSKFKIEYASFNQTNCSALYRELVDQGIQWQTTEDIMTTNGDMLKPSNWEQLFGIFYYCLGCTHWP